MSYLEHFSYFYSVLLYLSGHNFNISDMLSESKLEDFWTFSLRISKILLIKCREGDTKNYEQTFTLVELYTIY